jgi:hypothetical protein
MCRGVVTGFQRFLGFLVFFDNLLPFWCHGTKTHRAIIAMVVRIWVRPTRRFPSPSGVLPISAR